MTNTELQLREEDRFRQEWAHRFGFLAIDNPPTSFESIDEVATIINNQTIEFKKENEILLEGLRQIRERGIFHSDWSGQCSLYSCDGQKRCVHMIARDTLQRIK